MLKHAATFCPVVLPLAFPYKPLRGEIPFYILDRLIFEAIEACRSRDSLAVFMIRAWEKHSYPHIKIMHVLSGAGITKQINGFWFWSVAARAERSVASTARAEADKKPPGFFASVVVAPRISPMGWTPPQKNDPEMDSFSV